MYQDKTDVKYGANGTTVDYTLGRRMEFVPHLSRGRENDSVTVPNIPALVCVETSTFYAFVIMLFFIIMLLKGKECLDDTFWLDGLVVREMDLASAGHRFDFWLRHCQASTLGNTFTNMPCISEVTTKWHS